MPVDPEQVAQERMHKNRFSKTRHGILNDDERVELDGVLGELAFARYMGLPETEVHAKGPTSANFTLLDGTRVDVRSTRIRKGRLIVPPAIVQRGTIDVFVLAHVNAPRWGKPTVEDVTLLGWETASAMQAQEPKVISQRPGATPVHAIWAERLRKMPELRDRNAPQTLRLL